MIRNRDDLIHAIDALPVSRITKKTYYISIKNGYLINDEDIENREWTLKEFEEPFVITDPLLAEIEDVAQTRRGALAERDDLLSVSRIRTEAARKIFGGRLVPRNNRRAKKGGSKGR